MKNRILLIVGEDIRDPILAELARLDINCICQIEEFTELHEVIDIYGRYKDEVDGIITGGRLLSMFLKKTFGEILLPMETLNVVPSHIYFSILKELNSQPDLRLDRIVIDYTLPLHLDATLSDLIRQGGIEKVGNELAQWIENASLEELLSFAAKVDRCVSQLWESRKIDFVICLYSVASRYFKARGIPFCLPCPSIYELDMRIRSINYKISLHRQQKDVSEVTSEELVRIAGQCKLSVQTIQKLYTMVHLTNSNHVTSKLLTERFHTTARNANRILKKLVLGGVATESHTQLTNHTGHPEKVYDLHLD